MISVRLLAPFRVSRDGEELALQHKQILLIQALYCASGPVIADALMRKIWEQPKAGSRQTLRSHVSRIGKAVAAAGGQPGELVVTGRLDAAQFTYELADGLDIDVDRFRQLAFDGSATVRDSDYRHGAKLLAEALSLWGGTPDDDRRPMPEAASCTFAVDRRKALRTARKNALLDMLTAYISLGRHQEAVAELEQVAKEFPREEKALRLLAIALYRSERMADATDVCRKAITALHTTGHHDGHFQELQQGILNRTLPFRGSITG